MASLKPRLRLCASMWMRASGLPAVSSDAAVGPIPSGLKLALATHQQQPGHLMRLHYGEEMKEQP
jgi:hypothetical protein